MRHLSLAFAAVLAVAGLASDAAMAQFGPPPMGGLPRPPMGGLPRPPMGGMPRPPVGGLPRGPVGGPPRALAGAPPRAGGPIGSGNVTGRGPIGSGNIVGSGNLTINRGGKCLCGSLLRRRGRPLWLWWLWRLWKRILSPLHVGGLCGGRRDRSRRIELLRQQRKQRQLLRILRRYVLPALLWPALRLFAQRLLAMTAGLHSPDP